MAGTVYCRIPESALRMYENEPHTIRKAVLVAVQRPDVDDRDFAESLAELRRLAKTLKLEIAGTCTQRRSTFDAGTYLGSGKLEELKILVEGGTADTILVDHEISPSQARNLQKATRAVVMDRTAVILRLQYMAPRLREQATGRDRQRGGVGGRGPGESNPELDRRTIRYP